MTTKRRAKKTATTVVLTGFMLIMVPVVLLAGAGNPPSCTPTSGGTATTTKGSGTYAKPLTLKPNHWYTIGATEYGGPSDPSSGDFGSSGAYLPAAPNSFAELSTLASNPANSGGTFNFSDANALGALPYGTGIRVANGTRSEVLYKRDIGYGQGPGQSIPYRMDVWYAAAQQLGISKSTVKIELAPSSGAGGVLGQIPPGGQTLSVSPPAGTSSSSGATQCSGPGVTGPLPTTSGPTATILPNGEAAAPAGAPQQVKDLIAAGNAINSKPYVWGGGHGQPLTQIAAGYDCSGSTSYDLHGGGFLGDYALVSGDLEKWGESGPGKWVTVYANSAHAFIEVAGIVMDTVPITAPNPAGSGPRWQPASIVPTQYAADIAAGNGGFVQRHPKGF